MLAYLTETLVAFSQVRPLLIIVDDLHLADELSGELLRTVFRTSSLANVNLLATYQLQRRAQLAGLFDFAQVRRFELAPLSAEAIASLVSDMLALTPPPAELVDHLVEGPRSTPTSSPSSSTPLSRGVDRARRAGPVAGRRRLRRACRARRTAAHLAPAGQAHRAPADSLERR